MAAELPARRLWRCALPWLSACPWLCPGFTHWRAAVASQWQMAEFRDGGEQTRHAVFTFVSCLRDDLPQHRQEGWVGSTFLSPSILPREKLPVCSPCRNYLLILNSKPLHQSQILLSLDQLSMPGPSCICISQAAFSITD